VQKKRLMSFQMIVLQKKVLSKKRTQFQVINVKHTENRTITSKAYLSSTISHLGWLVREALTSRFSLNKNMAIEIISYRLSKWTLKIKMMNTSKQTKLK